MQFQIPQFIEEEDKLFGPLTFKQFIYVAGGAGAVFIIYVLIPWRWLAFLIIVPVGTLAGLLAFKPINNRPFELLLEAAFHFISRDKLYLWRREYQEEAKRSANAEAQVSTATEEPKQKESKLDEISWNLEVGNQKPKNRV